MRHILLGKVVILVALQSAIVNPSHTLIILQELSHLLRILAMLAHTQVQALQAQVQDE